MSHKLRTRRQRRRWGVEPKRQKDPKRHDETKRSQKRFGIYQERNRILSGMGFVTYGEYLLSELWRRIRAKILRRDGYLCRFCSKARATVVHHGSYDGPTLRGEKLSKLLSSCKPCHESLELTSTREKIQPSEVQRETKRRIKKAEKRERERRKAPRAELAPPTGTDEEMRSAGAAVSAAFGNLEPTSK